MRVIQAGFGVAGVGGEFFLAVGWVGGVWAVAVFAVGEVFADGVKAVLRLQQPAAEPGVERDEGDGRRKGLDPPSAEFLAVRAAEVECLGGDSAGGDVRVDPLIRGIVAVVGCSVSTVPVRRRREAAEAVITKRHVAERVGVLGQIAVGVVDGAIAGEAIGGGVDVDGEVVGRVGADFLRQIAEAVVGELLAPGALGVAGGAGLNPSVQRIVEIADGFATAVVFDGGHAAVVLGGGVVVLEAVGTADQRG